MISLGYPTFVTIDGVRYNLNTGYKYSLACFSCINDTEISDVERAYAIIGILFKEEPHDQVAAMDLAIKFLRCGKEDSPEVSSSANKRDMDYEHDFSYIKSSFISDYKIDLDDVDMHWWKFCNLVNGLTDECILNRIRDIRNYDINTIKDAKAKAKMQKAQNDVALPDRMTLEEQSIVDDFEAMFET